MPVFNEEKTLSKAIESVLGQSYSNFELIIIDDCSYDDSLSIMKHYAKIDNRIKIIENDRNSRSSMIQWEPRNDGLKHATGRLISYLDGDNTWDKEFLSSLVKVFDEQPHIAIAFCDSKNHYSKDELALVLQNDQRNLKDYGENWSIFSIEEVEPKNLGHTQYIDTNEMMHRADVFNDLTHLWGTFHPNREVINKKQALRKLYRRHNDLDLAERIIEKFGIDCCYHLKQTLVNYFYDSYYFEQNV